MSRSMEALVSGLERSYGDLALRAVARWKSEGAGRLAVGCLPVFAPREVLWAAGALPVMLRGGGDGVETVRGDAHYQSYICRLPRSTVELGLAGNLDVFDGMVFPNTCDVIRNLSGMWRSLCPRHLVRFLDPPQTGCRESGVKWYRHELESLYLQVCRLSRREPSDQALEAAILEYDLVRRANTLLAEARAREPWNVPCDEAYLVRRAGDRLPPLDYANLVQEYLELARRRGRKPEDRIRVILVGGFCEQPPLGLLRAVERSGCYLVDDDLTVGTDGLESTLSSDGAARSDPLGALARAYVESTASAPVRYDEEASRGRDLVARVRRLRADGVLFAAPSFCDPALLERPRLTKVLDDQGVPYTAFKYAENTGQFQAIREQAGTFADSVKLWGHA